MGVNLEVNHGSHGFKHKATAKKSLGLKSVFLSFPQNKRLWNMKIHRIQNAFSILIKELYNWKRIGE